MVAILRLWAYKSTSVSSDFIFCLQKKKKKFRSKFKIWTRPSQRKFFEKNESKQKKNIFFFEEKICKNNRAHDLFSRLKMERNVCNDCVV